MNKRVVITGGTGFIGANLTHRLLSLGCDVHLLLRATSNVWRLTSILNDVEKHYLALENINETKTTLSQIRPDWIFHLAAYGAYSSQSDREQIIKTNLISTMHLVDACVNTGFEAFINAGSSSEYGFKDHAPTELELLEPNSNYAITKAAATHYCSWIAQSQQANITTLRLYSVYGPFEEPSRLIPRMITEGLKGYLPPLVNPNISRDFIYTDDVVDACLLAAQNADLVKAKVYNVGTGIQTSLKEVVDTACRLLPITQEPQWGTMPNRSWDTSVWLANHSRITNELGWSPKVRFEDGFQKTIDWLQKSELLGFYQGFET